MPKPSAGIVAYRRIAERLEVLLVHPGGPFWAKKDAGAWTIPKGEIVEGEDPLAAARREFAEETGTAVPESAPARALQPVRLKGGKVVHAWAVELDLDATALRSNTFRMEWPPHSGRQQEFPEVDRAAWMEIPPAKARVLEALVPLLDELVRVVAPGSGGDAS